MSTFSPKESRHRQRTPSSTPGPIAPARSIHHQQHPILNLQRTIGNQAALRLMQAPARSIQRKLSINEPGDAYEQEADRVSEQVMRMPESRTAAAGASSAAPRVQRACACGGTCDDCKKSHPENDPVRVQMKAAGPANASGMEAPPIVHEVLRSPGQPLDRATRAFMEPRFGNDFSEVRVHTDTKAAESARAVGAEAYTSGCHIAFESPLSLPEMRDGRLLAHELTHVIQQTNGRQAGVHAATSGPATSIARSPKSEQSKFVGMRLGKSGSGEDVRVIRNIGSPTGYEERLQAIAVARLWKVENAAVVQGLSGDDKWYALEVSGPLADDNTADSPTRAVYPVRPLSSIGDENNRDQAIRKHREEILRGKETEGEAITKEREAELEKDWDKAKISRAGAILGVPESEIEMHESSGDTRAGKVNIIEKPPKDQGNARTGPVGAVGAGSAGTQYAIQVDLDTLFDPGEAQAAFFHETIHLQDFRLAQMWADRYRKEKDSSFDPGDAAAFRRFQEWIDGDGGKGRITKPDAEIVKQLAGRGKSYSGAGTEVRANLRTFLELLRAGQPEMATKKLTDYVVALQAGALESPEKNSPVRQELVKELTAAYQEMPETMKDQYDKAVAAALKEYPQAWILEIDLSKIRKEKAVAK